MSDSLKKRIIGIVVILLLIVMLSGLVLSAFATDNNSELSLSEALNQSNQAVENKDSSENKEIIPENNTSTLIGETSVQNEAGNDSQESSKAFAEMINEASDLTKKDLGTGADVVNGYIGTGAAYLIRILAFFICAFLGVRIVLDLCYITLPFTRGILGNGFGGTAQTVPRTQGTYPQNNNTVGNQTGRIQLISNDALNAVASASTTNEQGKPNSALKIYAKSEIIILVVTPILLILAATGALTNVGIALGESIVSILSRIANVI